MGERRIETPPWAAKLKQCSHLPPGNHKHVESVGSLAVSLCWSYCSAEEAFSPRTLHQRRAFHSLRAVRQIIISIQGQTLFWKFKRRLVCRYEFNGCSMTRRFRQRQTPR